jgi:DNA phosphorothioation-associated putative methyltransferase
VAGAHGVSLPGAVISRGIIPAAMARLNPFDFEAVTGRYARRLMSTIGKKVARHHYIHITSIESLPAHDAKELIAAALQAIGPEASARVNVVKIPDELAYVSLLSYPDFETDPFPALEDSWTWHLNGDVTYRTYGHSLNPPILHRKELLVPSDWPGRPQWVQLTETAESIGLFDETRLIGFRLNWERAIASRGYQLDGYQLIAIGNETAPAVAAGEVAHAITEGEILRYRTALSRSSLSAPIQALLRHELLSHEVTLFDYGCGRGDDIEALTCEGYAAKGWDPHYAPTNPVESADLVNLGFVVNVIEDPAERVEAIRSAFKLAKRAMVVAVMLPGSKVAGVPWRDGYRTERDTFQKYFSQDEFRDYLELVLETQVTLVGPGVALIFRDKEWEQQFLLRKYRRLHVAEWLVQKARSGIRRSRENAPRRRAEARPSKEQQLLDAVRPLLHLVWMQALDLGRIPEPEEVEERAELEEKVGSWSRVTSLLRRHYDLGVLEEAARVRCDDVLVFLVAQLFQRRRPYKSLEARLQRDVRSFFTSYDGARQQAARLLVQTADTNALLLACQDAAQRGLGYLEGQESLHVRMEWVERLPVVLRAYIACALVLWAETADMDVVKIHISSGKVTLLQYQDFDDCPLPLLTRRVKVNLREADYDLFEYNPPAYPPPYLYWKSRLLNEESLGYGQQLIFDEQLEAVGVRCGLEFGPDAESLARTLSLHRLEYDGLSLRPSQTIPDLDQLCGKSLRYRDLIECGETQARLGLPNLPLNPATYNALHALCVNVLDPVIEHFGAIRLTYGFCSPGLAKHIPARIAPNLDQHAGCETGPRGRFVCQRGGAAIDFIVEDEDMREVACWIIENTPFDRLYFYGVDRPLHVSFGPENSRAAYEMAEHKPGVRIPRPFRMES